MFENSVTNSQLFLPLVTPPGLGFEEASMQSDQEAGNGIRNGRGLGPGLEAGPRLERRGSQRGL